MKGITEERLRELLQDLPCGDEKYATLDYLLGRECKELNPWQPIDGNTPKDRQIVLSYPELGAHDGCWIVDSWYCDLADLADSREQPTHWQKLPEDQE